MALHVFVFSLKFVQRFAEVANILLSRKSLMQWNADLDRLRCR